MYHPLSEKKAFSFARKRARKKRMNNLPRVIGKAPSELSPVEFRKRLTRERDRARREIELFQTNIPPKKKAKAAKAIRKELDKLMKAKGLTPEKLQELIRARGKEKPP